MAPRRRKCRQRPRVSGHWKKPDTQRIPPAWPVLAQYLTNSNQEANLTPSDGVTTGSQTIKNRRTRRHVLLATTATGWSVASSVNRLTLPDAVVI